MKAPGDTAGLKAGVQGSGPLTSWEWTYGLVAALGPLEGFIRGHAPIAWPIVAMPVQFAIGIAGSRLIDAFNPTGRKDVPGVFSTKAERVGAIVGTVILFVVVADAIIERVPLLALIAIPAPILCSMAGYGFLRMYQAARSYLGRS